MSLTKSIALLLSVAMLCAPVTLRANTPLVQQTDQAGAALHLAGFWACTRRRALENHFNDANRMKT